MKPVVKWAGGKTQLLDRLVPLVPRHYGRYFEPFIGGAALLLALTPENPVIGDINPELVNLYRQIRENPDAFLTALAALDQAHEQAQDKKTYYYAARDAFNRGLSSDTAKQAAHLVYLNKHCFNGLYRVNGKGLFNVPFNNKQAGDSFSKENILQVSSFLQKATIVCSDFEETVAEAREGDFVFFDSPYAPLNPTSFTDYTKEGFALDDHKRLAALFRRLAERGVFCLLTNHDTELIRSLYSGFPIQTVQVARNINSLGSARTGSEVIITSHVHAL